MKVGRPLQYETKEELQDAVDKYFKTDAYMGEGEDRQFAPTMSGLARSLGLSRQGLIRYDHRDKFGDTIKNARAIVEEHLERRLYGNAVTGVIFNLKNNFDWKDKQETELSGGVSVKQTLASRLTGGSKR